MAVAEVVAETADACSLVLDVPVSLASAFRYSPGQFITVRVPSDRAPGSVARCYSLCSSPVVAGDRPAIAVKRTAGGYASNWLVDHAAPGFVLDVLSKYTGVPGFKDFDELLDKTEPEAAILATPSSSHATISSGGSGGRVNRGRCTFKRYPAVSSSRF